MESAIHLQTHVSSILTSAEIVFATTQKGGLLPGGPQQAHKLNSRLVRLEREQFW